MTEEEPWLTKNVGWSIRLTRAYLQELEDWATHGVEAHFRARHPWMPYHENVAAPSARLVGAKPSEVVVMNTLTVNLHLMMVSFYRPDRQRFKIVTGWPQSDPVTGESNPQWSTLEQFTMEFEGGEFRHAMEEAVIQGIPNPGYQFRFEAEGYLPHITRPVKPEEGKVRLEVRLKSAAAK